MDIGVNLNSSEMGIFALLIILFYITYNKIKRKLPNIPKNEKDEVEINKESSSNEELSNKESEDKEFSDKEKELEKFSSEDDLTEEEQDLLKIISRKRK